MHGGGQRCFVLVIETRQKPVISIWDISREEQTKTQCVSGDEAKHGRWAGAAVADFDTCQAVVTTRDKSVQLWDLRHLSQPAAESDPHVASANSLLYAYGLGTSRARAACTSHGGNIHLLDVTGEGGEINKLQTLYGHVDDVRCLNIVWPTEEEQAAEEHVHGASLSVDGELLLWDFPWPLLADEDEDTAKVTSALDASKRNNIRSEADELEPLSDNEESRVVDSLAKSSWKKPSSFTRSFDDAGLDVFGQRRTPGNTAENDGTGSRPDTPDKMTAESAQLSPTTLASDVAMRMTKTISMEPDDDLLEVRRATTHRSRGRRKLNMLDNKIVPRMLPTTRGLRCKAVAWERRAVKDEICALTGTSDGTLHGWLEGDPSDQAPILKEAEVGAVHGHTDQITAICANFQTEIAVTASLDKTLRIWQLKADFFNCTEILEGHDATIRALVCDFDIGRAVSGGADKSIRIWDLGRSAGGASAASLGELHAPGSGVRELLASFSGGHAAAVARDGSLRIWDLERLQQVALIDTHPGAVFAVQLGTELGTFGPAPEEDIQLQKTSRAALLSRHTRKVVRPAVTCGRGYSKSMW